MARIFLTGKDWRSRALLRAQLLEEGVEVEAYETPGEALNSVTSLANLPLLILADLGHSPRPEADIDLLSRWKKLVPAWIFLPHILEIQRNLQESGIERILLRPIDVKKLVQELKERGANR